MIDTDKYEGHKPAPWVWDINGVGQYESLRCNELEDYTVTGTKVRIASKVDVYDVPTAELMADAPLLLAEVMRLHEGIEKLANSMEISANKGKNRMSWPTRLLWVDSLKELIENTKGRTSEVKQLREWKAEVERICRTMNGPNRDTALFIMTNEVEEE